MKRTALLLLLCGAAAALAAQDKTDTTAPKPKDSPLVRAARANGGKPHIPSGKVITNADVRKSKGKLVVLPPKPEDAAKTAAPAADSTIGPIEAWDAKLRSEKAADDRVAAAAKKVADLQRQLRGIEDSYYAADDPNVRDRTIVPQFANKKQELETAQQALADAREARQKLTAKAN
jgi:hypothetical protein